jgi:uncharacterized protein YdeI (YjbR/CyaY-like superfamily)
MLHQLGFVLRYLSLNWIVETKKPETRQRRIEKVIQELLEKSRD